MPEDMEWLLATTRSVLDWGRRIFSYFWNDRLEAVKVLNDEEDFVIEHFGKEILCSKNEITTIERVERLNHI